MESIMSKCVSGGFLFISQLKEEKGIQNQFKDPSLHFSSVQLSWCHLENILKEKKFFRVSNMFASNVISHANIYYKAMCRNIIQQ